MSHDPAATPTSAQPAPSDGTPPTTRPPTSGRGRWAAWLGALGVLAISVPGVSLGGSVRAASPAVGASPTVAVTPTQSPTPTLIMGPLLALPPIGTPPVLSPATLADGYALGAAGAAVTIDIWEDFQCPYCLRFTEIVEPQLVNAYVLPGTARLVYHDLPFLGEESRWASVAARLAEQQGRFWQFHDYLYANQRGENVGSFTLDRLQEIASAVGLDRAAFDAGLQMDAARRTYAQIDQEASAGATSLGINATPTVLVDGVPVAPPNFANIQSAVEAALAKTAASLPPTAAPSPASSAVTPAAP